MYYPDDRIYCTVGPWNEMALYAVVTPEYFNCKLIVIIIYDYPAIIPRLGYTKPYPVLSSLHLIIAKETFLLFFFVHHQTGSLRRRWIRYLMHTVLHNNKSLVIQWQGWGLGNKWCLSSLELWCYHVLSMHLLWCSANNDALSWWNFMIFA